MSQPLNIPQQNKQATQNQNLVIPTTVPGSQAQNFTLQSAQVSQAQNSDFVLPYDDNTPDASLYLSDLGTAVLIDLTFHGQTYTNEQGLSRTFPDITLETVLLSVSQSKRIVETAVQGRKGTVKEYIGLGDYAVSISVTINGTNGSYPVDDVQSIITMLECPNSITVTSRYLNMFSISSIVIDSYSINQGEGSYSSQEISISALSDGPENLIF